MGKTLEMVGNLLLNRQAILLPCIHDQFTTYIREIVAAKGFHETHVTSRRILSELTANFQHHIAFSCKVRKYGTLVYRRNSNLIRGSFGILHQHKMKVQVTTLKIAVAKNQEHLTIASTISTILFTPKLTHF